MRVPLKVLVSAAVISMTGLAFAALSQNFVISYSGGATDVLSLRAEGAIWYRRFSTDN